MRIPLLSVFMKRLVLLVVLVLVAALLVTAGVYSFVFWSRGEQQRVQRQQEALWQAQMSKALSAHATGRDSDSELILSNMLREANQWWPTGPDIVENLSWLGTIYRVEHKHEQSAPLLKRAVQISEQQGSASTTAVGRAQMNLGIIARDKLNDAEAEERFTAAAEILGKDPQAAWGDDDAALLNLGFLANKKGHYQEAVSYLTRAVAGYDKLFGRIPQPDQANAHLHLGDVYVHLDNFAEAAQQYKTSLEIYEQLEGPEGVDTKNAASDLAIVQHDLGVTDYQTQDHTKVPTNPENASGTTLNGMANDAYSRKNYTEAESLYQHACEAFEKAGGPYDLGLAAVLVNLGNLYRDLPEFDMRRAELPLKRALAIREKVLGLDHPETADVLSDLSLLYFFEKKLAAAEMLAKRALPIEEKAFGADSLPVSTTLNRIGISERDTGKFKEAEANLRRALAIREKQHAPESWIAISLENLACVYSMQGNGAKAVPLMARAQAIRSRPSTN